MAATLKKLHSDFSVDCVVFGFDEGELKILLIDRNEAPFKDWKAIPGNLVGKSEDIDHAASRVLYELTGLKDVYQEQLYTFGKVNRHPQGRVITVAYYSIIRRTEEGLHPMSSFAREAYWWPANDLPKLAFDHNEIAEKALQRLREKILVEPIGIELLPKEFTLTQLQHVYEAITGDEVDKRNFRKRILGSDLLKQTNKKQAGVAHRAAYLYTFNEKKYKKLKNQGMIFGI